ncbi:Protein of unknown function [Noviherbaspirillum humi]|uniref:DUF3833 domain-containing protein n=1 Tax=Noviherbaspirillum humi TaxID=1688639 RepID=A0A239CIA0_9BURK|nr:DUF3833 domain-containing protein [Noviherbaspirillum humi]SNS19408.1 Protein of unknown function [Noviherbaspirillum humi]
MLKRTLFTIAALLAALSLGGCAATLEPSRYAAEKPALDLQQYFNGTIDAWGMFQNRSGEVVKRFTVVMTCAWKGDTGTLDEDFTYADGSKQRRVWTLRKVAPDRFVGTADDIVGEATGIVAGNALRWRYTMALPVDGKTYQVDFEDWMFLMDDRVMLNRAVMSKFGFRLGEVTLSFRKRP